jgi:hypothetical protein
VTRGRLTIWLLVMRIALWLLLMVRVIVGVAISRCKNPVEKFGQKIWLKNSVGKSGQKIQLENPVRKFGWKIWLSILAQVLALA